ncbi:beta-lactamase/transpeptidase-like protein [Chiua virens]|nr:beta-lactamase/transpeptidase-like protein [Chiua virens]
MSKDTPSPSSKRVNVQPATPRWVQWSLLLNAVALAALFQALPEVHECRAPLPSFLATKPPFGTNIHLQNAFRQLDSALQHSFDQGGIESLSVAVVGSEGPLYEVFLGKRQANESEDTTVDQHSIYRLASISKLFTALETLILRDRGVLRLDDPVSSVCPELQYNKYYAPITFRSLMSHMSGLGRDLPPGNALGHWPNSLFGAGPPEYNGREFPSRQDVFDGIAQSRPAAAPYTYPVYSNTGYSLLGIANVAANIAANGPSSPQTHAELMQQDIFGPLGFNGTIFLVTEETKSHVVVSSANPWEIDQDFKDASNPSGGQMSSLSDLTKLMQILINPRRPESVLSPHTVREWMRPMHSWFDDYSEVGALWEIFSSIDSYGRKQKLYQKVGELPGYHTAFTVNPVSSCGIIVLQSGPAMASIGLTKLIMNYGQPAFDRVLEDATRDNVAGTWHSMDGSTSLTVEIDSGSMYVKEYSINGTDVIRVMQDDQPGALTRLPLWEMGNNQYRLVTPTPGEGCLIPWVNLDMYGYIDGVSTNVFVFETDDQGERVLVLPAINAQLRK